jgi:hypothetical protein
MTSVSAGRFVGLSLPRWRDVPAHAVMLVVMAATMIGGHSTIRELAGLGALGVTAMVCAPFSRADPTFREHLVDLGAMAVLLVGCLPGHAPDGLAHDHFALANGPAVFAAALGGWALGRIFLWRRMHSGPWNIVASGVPVAAGLIAMVVVCGHL